MRFFRSVQLFILFLAVTPAAFAQTTAFIYQGNLNFSGQPANGSFDFEFALYDDADAGNQLGPTRSVNGVAVSNGRFAVNLDFGNQFPGAARFLEVRVRQTGQPGITILGPRQPIRSVPYALKSIAAETVQTAVTATNATNAVSASTATTATTANNALSLGGVAAGQYVLTGDARLSDARNPLPGSQAYIQNQSAGPQPSSSFNISGNAIVGGSVGAGATPTEKLDIAGNIKFSGHLIGHGSGLTNVKVETTTNQSLLGSLRWDLLGSRTFGVGDLAFEIAFDGINIWLANGFSNYVTKLRASDGANLGRFLVVGFPRGLAFDGANIWVTKPNLNSVTKLRASDGADLGTFSAGSGPRAAAFDGANIWVSNSGSNNVTKLRASDGTNLGTFLTGAGPAGVAFDGANIWIANEISNNVTKLRASDGANLGTFPTGAGPHGITFDGAHIWTTNVNGNNVTKLRASDGSFLGNFPVGTYPRGMAFDGTNIWVANQDSHNVTKLRASDGANLGTFPVGILPQGVAFDGANIWIVNDETNVTRLPAFP